MRKQSFRHVDGQIQGEMQQYISISPKIHNMAI